MTLLFDRNDIQIPFTNSSVITKTKRINALSIVVNLLPVTGLFIYESQFRGDAKR
jgi:hypothetical protein